MQINDALLARLETLSQLAIPEEKKESIKEELSEIVNFVEVLNTLDVSHVSATYSTLEGGTPMREDTPSNDPDIAKGILSHAPKAQDGYFIVPKIIE